MAIIKEWLNHDCQDPVETIAAIILITVNLLVKGLRKITKSLSSSTSK